MSPTGNGVWAEEFSGAGTSGDPGALIGFLDAARAVPGLAAAHRGLLERLALDRAATALDVGCGPGTDLAEMARRMPPGSEVTGIDASPAMIAEARRRTADLGQRVSLRVGQAADLPYPDGTFDATRTAAVLQHVPDPARVVAEMARVTRPGGRVAALEFDQGTTFLDHPDSQTTRIVLDTFTDAAVQGQIGRRLARLFRLAGLSDVSVTPLVALSSPGFWRILYRGHVARLQDQGVLTREETVRWWADLDDWTDAGGFLAGTTIFVVGANRPR